MKKILLVMLVVISFLGLIACGSKDESYEPYFPETDFSIEVDEFPVQEPVEDISDPVAAPEEVEQEEQADDHLNTNFDGLLSFDEINFLGEYDILSLQTEQVKELLQSQGMEVTTNADRRYFDSTPLEIYGNFPDYTGTEVTVFKYDEDEYIHSWTFVHRPTDGEKKIDLGVRDVTMYDTFAEVLEKIGFHGTEKTELKLYELVGDVWFPDLEKSKLEEIQKIVNFSYNDEFFMRISAGTYFIDNKRDSFELDIANYSSMDGVIPDEKIELSFKFVRSEETENKYILTQFSFSVW